MKIFMCHASEQHDLAARLATALRAEGHQVFLDRDDLPPGSSFDDRIRRSVRACHLFVFLISPKSIERSAYTLSELKFARERWPNPSGHVLPVMAVETPFEMIPGYLSGLTVLQPEGNLTAELLSETEMLQQRKHWLRRMLLATAPATAVALLLALGVYASDVYYFMSSFSSLTFASENPPSSNSPHSQATPSVTPAGPASEIRDKARELDLGDPDPETPEPWPTSAPRDYGHWQRFERGLVYWSPGVGARAVVGSIAGKWAELGREQGLLGFPLTDELRTSDGQGRYNDFEGGFIYWSPATDAHEVHGAIKEKWASLRGEIGPLGYPVSDEHADADFRRSDFQRGFIRWSQQTGAEVHPHDEG